MKPVILMTWNSVPMRPAVRLARHRSGQVLLRRSREKFDKTESRKTLAQVDLRGDAAVYLRSKVR